MTKEYKDKELKSSFIPASLKKSKLAQRGSAIIIIVSIFFILSFTSKYNLLNLSQGDDNELRAKMVKFNAQDSVYKDNDVNFNHVDLSKLGTKPHAITKPQEIKGKGRAQKNGYSEEDDIDRTIDSKVVASINKGSAKLDHDELHKGKPKLDSKKPDPITLSPAKVENDKEERGVPAALAQHKAGSDKEQDTTASPTAGGASGSVGAIDKDTQEKGSGLKALPVINPVRTDGKKQLVVLQQETIDNDVKVLDTIDKSK